MNEFILELCRICLFSFNVGMKFFLCNCFTRVKCILVETCFVLHMFYVTIFVTFFFCFKHPNLSVEPGHNER